MYNTPNISSTVPYRCAGSINCLGVHYGMYRRLVLSFRAPAYTEERSTQEHDLVRLQSISKKGKEIAL